MKNSMKKGDVIRRIPFSPPDVGDPEIEKISEVIHTGWITTGPRVKRLEQRLQQYFLTGKNTIDAESDGANGIHRTVCLSSATAALELNLRLLGIGPGDEVIVPAYTYTATASPVIHCGARLVLVDIQKDGDPETHAPEMDYDALERAVGPKTKAIIAADLAGLVCDYDRIFDIVERKKHLFSPKEPDGTVLGDMASRIQKSLGCIAVVADCAHSLGSSRCLSQNGSGPLDTSRLLSCGVIAHFSSFSFHAVKNMTTAEGGASTWCLPASVYDQGISDDDIYRMYQMLSLHGQTKDALSKGNTGSWEYDVAGPWYKCNMTDISAAMGLAQLDRYEGLLRRRRELISIYDHCCDELGIFHLNHNAAHVRSNGHLYLIRIPHLDESERNELINVLEREGVSTNVHYKPLPMLTAYRSLGWDIAHFPNAYDYYRCLITLPLYSKMTDEDAEYVCISLKKAIDAAAPRDK